MVPIVRKTVAFYSRILLLTEATQQTAGSLNMWLTFFKTATRDRADKTFLTWYIPIIEDLAGGDYLHLLEYDSDYGWEKRQLW